MEFTTELWIGAAFGAFCGWMLRAVLFPTKEDIEHNMNEGLKLPPPRDDEPSLEETDRRMEQLGADAQQVSEELRRLAEQRSSKKKSP